VECLKDMWELQNTEIEMVKLRREWAQLKELLARDKDDELAAIQKSLNEAREQWRTAKKNHDETVAEIEQISRKLEQLNCQLYEEGGQSKELISIQQNIEQLEKRKAVLEDRQLSTIEELDQLEQRIADETRRFQRLEEQKRSRNNRMNLRLEEIRAAYGDLKQRREELRAIIPNYMMAIYNDLVAQKKRPMATLKGDCCSGCGMTQTVLNVNALKKGGQYTRCSSCGRILVLAEAVNKGQGD